MSDPKCPGELAEELFERLTLLRDRLLPGAGGNEEARQTVEAALARLEPIPQPVVLRRMLDTAFYATLAEEEGKLPQFSILYADPEMAAESQWPRLEFEEPLPFVVETIRKLSPAIASNNVDLGVFAIAGELKIWGLVYARHEHDGLRTAPAGLQIKSRQVGVLAVAVRWKPVLIFARGHATFTDTEAIDRAGLRRILSAAFDEEGDFPDQYRRAARLLDLAEGALERGIGATLLLCKADGETACLDPPRYRPSERSKQQLGHLAFGAEASQVRSAVGLLAGVDGAMVFNDAGEFVGAGAMIRTEGVAEFDVLVLDPSLGPKKLQTISLSQFSGGARHRSALIWVHRNPGAVALVVSHDGVMSLLVRPAAEKNVLAIRPFRRGLLQG